MSLFQSFQRDILKAIENYKIKENTGITSEEHALIFSLQNGISEIDNGVQLRFYMTQRVNSMPKTMSYYLPWTNSLRYDLEQVLANPDYSLNNLLFEKNIELQEEKLKLQKEIRELTARLDAFQQLAIPIIDPNHSGQTSSCNLLDIAVLKEQLNQLTESVNKQGEEIELLKNERNVYKRQAETLRKEKDVLAERIKQLEDQNANLLRVKEEQAAEIQRLRQEKESRVHPFGIAQPPAKKTPYTMQNRCLPRNDKHRLQPVKPLTETPFCSV